MVNYEIELSASAVAKVVATAELTVTTYPQILLSTAENLLNSDQFSISIVVAHMACEIATERSLVDGFKNRQIDELEEPVLKFMNGFNLATERNRKLYSALTGDNIQKENFWESFKDSSTRRNNIIHKGYIATRSEASTSLAVAKEFVTHLCK